MKLLNHLSVGALSRQFPFGLIKHIMPNTLSLSWKAWLADYPAQNDAAALCWFPAEPSHAQRISQDVRRYAQLQRPANDFPFEQVRHDGQVQPAFIRPQVGYVRHPGLIRHSRREISVKQFFRPRQVILRDRRLLVAPLVAGVDTVIAHQTSTRAFLVEKPPARSSHSMRGLT